MPGARIMIVEDEPVVAESIETTLTIYGYTVTAIAHSGAEALRGAKATRPDLVLMDIQIEGDIDGVETADQIRSHLDIPVIYLTGYADEDILKRTRVTEPYGYILKPFQARELHTNIEIALYKHEMERKLKAHERWLSTTLRSIGDGVISTDVEARITFMNPVAETLTGWTQEEALGKDLEEVVHIIHERSRQTLENSAIIALRKEVIVCQGNYVLLVNKNGYEIPIHDTASPIIDDAGHVTGSVLAFHDILERKQMEEQIKTSLREKDLLLREVQHRVKNSLQLISSLLYLQARSAQSSDSLELIEHSQHRIELLSLIHDKIYQFRDITAIKPAEYFQELGRYVLDTYQTEAKNINLDFQMNGISLDIDTVIPCGLILSELISNALKYAFPQGESGEIRVELHQSADHQVELTVSDNGVGVPADIDVQKSTSLGLQLINLLARQIHGNIEVDRSAGTKVTIAFPV